METTFIDDGYSLPGYIAEKPGIHGAMAFTYRPMTRRESAAFVGKISATANTPQGTIDAERIAAEAIKHHLTDWDIKDRKGDPVWPTVDHVERLQPVLCGKLLQIVRGQEACDRRPEATTDPQVPDMDGAAKN